MSVGHMMRLMNGFVHLLLFLGQTLVLIYIDEKHRRCEAVASCFDCCRDLRISCLVLLLSSVEMARVRISSIVLRTQLQYDDSQGSVSRVLKFMCKCDLDHRLSHVLLRHFLLCIQKSSIRTCASVGFTALSKPVFVVPHQYHPNDTSRATMHSCQIHFDLHLSDAAPVGQVYH